MQRMHGVVQSKGGRVVVGALIQVFLTGTSTPATIYSNKAGTQEVTQLLSDNEGEWSFYAANGRYDIKTVINGRVDGQLIDVLLHDQADVPAASVDASVLADITAIKADITTLKGDQSNLSAQVQVVDSKTKDFDNAHGTEIVKGNWADGRVAPVAELADADGSAMIGHGDATLGSVVTANSSSISTLLTDMSAAKTDLVNVNSDLDALELADYAALRAYTGTRKNAYIVAQSSAGMFLRDDADTAVLATPVNAAFTLTSGSLAAATYSYRISAIDAFGETLGSTATTIAVPAKLATPVNAAFSVAPGSLAAATYYYRVSAINAVGETLASTETSIAVPAPLATPSNTAFSTAITGGTLAAGTYHYRVSAINAVGETLASTSTSIASANLAAPVANAPSTAITGGSLAGATYYYKVSALGTQGETLGSNEVSVASANLAAPTANAPSTATTGGSLAAATYYYKVTALGASGETIGSNEVSIATTGTTSTVTVTWGAITGATGYRVYRGTTTGGQNVYYAPGNVTTFTDTGAANTAGTVPASNTAVSSTNTNTITWGAVTGATGYRVYRGTAAGGENVYYAPGNVTTYTDTGAASTAGSPPASNTATTNTNTVTVNWGAVTGATGYKIYGRTSGGHLFIATVGNVTAYIDTGSVTPAGALPASNTTSGGVVVNWGAVTGATGYKVYGRSTGAQLLIASVGAVTTYTDTGSVTPAGALPASNTTSGGVVLNWGAVANATGYKVYGRIAGSELFMAQLGTVTTYTDGGTVTPAGALPTGYKKDNSYTVIESTNGKRWKRDGFIASGTGAIARMAQDKLRDVVNVKDYGATPAGTDAANKVALQSAISAVAAAGGGTVVVGYDISYGCKTRDSATWPSFTGINVPVLVMDYGRGKTQDPNVYPTSYDGMQARVWFHTPQTTSFGQHDGNTYWWRGAWAPAVCVSNDANYAVAGHASRTSLDNRRANYAVMVDGTCTWQMGQGTRIGANLTNEEMSDFAIIKFSMSGDTLGDYTVLTAQRKTGNISYGGGRTIPNAHHHFEAVTGSPSLPEMIVESKGVTCRVILRSAGNTAKDITLRNNDGIFGVNTPVGDAIQVDYTNRRVWIPGSLQQRLQTVTYAATMTIDPSLGNIFVITPTDAVAFTLGQPALPALAGLVITITIRNTTAGALGAATWSPAFKMATWAQPAAGFSRSITFYCDGTNWIEQSRTAADVPN